MEDKKNNYKNNATEKVENIIEKNEVNSGAVDGVINDNVLTPAQQIKNEIEQEKRDLAKKSDRIRKEKRKKLDPIEKRQEKLQKELKKAEQREQNAIKKDEKKKEKFRKKDEKKIARKERKAEIQLERLKRKEDRLERRDMLKNETYAEKMERIAREKQMKRDAKNKKRMLKAEKRSERAMLRREKLQTRRALKEQKRRLRMENRRDKRSRGIGGWLAAVISLGCSVLVLATLFTFALVRNNGDDNMFENAVERTFYDLVSYVDNMEVNMSKLLVSNDRQEQQKLLRDITVQANLASADITELPIQDESKYYTTKYINQVGDYSKFLNNKLIDGGKISEEDWQNLEKLYAVNQTLKQELTSLTADINEDYRFVSLINDNGENIVLDSFISLEEGSVDYPKMIYDGPFSDGLDVTKVRGIQGKEVSKSEAVEIFKSLFTDYSFDSVEVVGETKGKIEVYDIEGSYGEDKVFAQVSKIGGKLIMFNSFKDCSKQAQSVENCVNIASEFIKKNGIDGMKAVWSSESSANVYVNFALEKNGVIVYPDMIKVTVCEERGIVSTFDATEYYLNHHERTIEKAKITKEKAVANVKQNLDVSTIRLAVIPLGNSNEALTYEVSGTFGGSTYYVYVDANTGKELEIFKVVQTLEGNLLI